MGDRDRVSDPKEARCPDRRPTQSSAAQCRAIPDAGIEVRARRAQVYGSPGLDWSAAGVKTETAVPAITTTTLAIRPQYPTSRGNPIAHVRSSIAIHVNAQTMTAAANAGRVHQVRRRIS
jgi:hypothetical protein